MAIEATRLRGHKRSVLCCAASPTTPHLISSSGEDGSVYWFDLRCKENASVMDLGKEPVASVCFSPGNDDILYVAYANTVTCLDVRMAPSSGQLQKYTFNTEDINQITMNFKSSFLAAADDSGEVKIIDIRQHCLYKTLRSVHTNICSSVQFHPWRPWEVISGGLDSKIVAWDFSRGRQQMVIDAAVPTTENAENASSANQICNPPFVHALAVPEENMDGKNNQVVAAARGDGTIEIIDLRFESHVTGAKSKQSSRARKGFQSKSSKNTNVNENIASGEITKGMRIQLHAGLGGHSTAASCVAFSRFGEAGKFIISGSNDASVKLWNWTSQIGSSSRSEGPLSFSINNKRKVNWLCTTSRDSENLIVCDTSKVVKAYTIL